MVQRKILKALTGLNGQVVIRVQDIANKIGSDPRTVRNHLEVMAMYHKVVFLDAAKTYVAKFSALKKFVQEQEAKQELDELLYWSANSGGVRLAYGEE